MIYLDNGATSFHKPVSVKKAVLDAMEHCANPGRGGFGAAMEAARRVQPSFCAMAARLVMETDYKMKTSYDDSERLLELLILQLAQEALGG